MCFIFPFEHDDSDKMLRLAAFLAELRQQREKVQSPLFPAALACFLSCGNKNATYYFVFYVSNSDSLIYLSFI